MSTLFWLIVSHCVCDYPLQGDFLAQGKNHKQALVGVPWYVCLAAHSMIHAGGVALATGSVELGMCEFVAHGVIDFLKCEGLLKFKQDQMLHIMCKVIWALSAWGIA